MNILLIYFLVPVSVAYTSFWNGSCVGLGSTAKTKGQIFEEGDKVSYHDEPSSSGTHDTLQLSLEHPVLRGGSPTRNTGLTLFGQRAGDVEVLSEESIVYLSLLIHARLPRILLAPMFLTVHIMYSFRRWRYRNALLPLRMISAKWCSNNEYPTINHRD